MINTLTKLRYYTHIAWLIIFFSFNVFANCDTCELNGKHSKPATQEIKARFLVDTNEPHETWEEDYVKLDKNLGYLFCPIFCFGLLSRTNVVHS